MHLENLLNVAPTAQTQSSGHRLDGLRQPQVLKLRVVAQVLLWRNLEPSNSVRWVIQSDGQEGSVRLVSRQTGKQRVAAHMFVVKRGQDKPVKIRSIYVNGYHFVSFFFRPRLLRLGPLPEILLGP